VGVLHFALYALLGVGAGALIGCVGIGGVIIVPVLVYLAGVPLPVAIAAAMFAFVVSGAVGLYAFARAGSIDWPTAAWLCLGAAPAAFAGATLVAIVPTTAIEAAIGAVTAAAGVHALVRRGSARPERSTSLSAPALAATGAATGLASALTGTGGPLLLVPALLWLDVPLLATLGSAQAIQLPIAAAATAGNVLADTLDVPLGLTLGAGIALGTAAGARAAHALPTAALRRLVAALLVFVGVGILLRLAIRT
jgi:uncharacterized membrane protein YfcA